MSCCVIGQSIKQVVPRSFQRYFSLHKLSGEHILVQKTCRQFADSKLQLIAGLLDKEQRFPAEQINELGALGLMGINASTKYGGAGHDTLAIAVAVEELSRGCGSTGSIVSIHNCLYANLVDSFGNETQKEQFLRPFTGGQVGCFALSEPDAGSDVSAMSTRAKLENGKYVLNGTKSWVTSGTVGKAVVVFATIDKKLKHKGITSFLVPLPCEGLSFGKLDQKLGIRAVPTCNIILDNVVVPKENILGELGGGFRIAMMQLDKARIGIAAQAIGIAQAALECAVKYSTQRVAFGKPISKLQAVKIRIGEMAVRLEAARLLVWRAAVMCDEPGRSTKESSMAKLAASEAANFITANTIQILGGMGFVEDMPAERHYRDARITEIYGGVTDIQKLLIGDLIIKEYS